MHGMQEQGLSGRWYVHQYSLHPSDSQYTLTQVFPSCPLHLQISLDNNRTSTHKGHVPTIADLISVASPYFPSHSSTRFNVNQTQPSSPVPPSSSTRSSTLTLLLISLNPIPPIQDERSYTSLRIGLHHKHKLSSQDYLHHKTFSPFHPSPFTHFQQ